MKHARLERTAFGSGIQCATIAPALLVFRTEILLISVSNVVTNFGNEMLSCAEAMNESIHFLFVLEGRSDRRGLSEFTSRESENDFFLIFFPASIYCTKIYFQASLSFWP